MGVNFPRAALRTHADAESLYGASRLGTADHLFGLAAECALKAVLAGLGVIPKGASPPPGSGFKVHVDKLWPQYAAYISGHGPATLVAIGHPFAGWRIDDRYEDDGTFDEKRLLAHRQGAIDAIRLLERARLAGYVP